MGMLQPGYNLGFAFKSANKLGLVRQPGQNNFDGNLASNRRLIGAIDGSKAASTNVISKFIPLDGLRDSDIHSKSPSSLNPLSIEQRDGTRQILLTFSYPHEAFDWAI